MMKKYFVPFLVVFAIYSSAFGQAVTPPWPEGSFSAYFGPSQAFRITITTDNGVVSVLEVPKGVFLNVVGSVEKNPDWGEGLEFPLTVQGDVTIRTRREDEVKANESRSAEAIMDWASLEMSLKNVVLHLEAIE